MCTGTPVHYEQTVREQVSRPGRRRRRGCTGVYGYTGTLRADSQGGSVQARKEEAARVYGSTGALGRGECARVHRYTPSKQAGGPRMRVPTQLLRPRR